MRAGSPSKGKESFEKVEEVFVNHKYNVKNKRINHLLRREINIVNI